VRAPQDDVCVCFDRLLIQTLSPQGRSRGPFSFCEIAMRRRPRVSRARLRKLLHYDPDTGEFRWRRRVRPAIPRGAIAGSLDIQGYWRITIKGRRYPAHHLAWLYKKGSWCSSVIDHRDGNRSNNRWSNLRSATRTQSNANRGLNRNNTCGLKGVSRNGQRWRAAIHKNRRKRHLGNFPTPQDAHAAYAKEARKLFGEFARTE
jgi:HNH endonuclease